MNRYDVIILGAGASGLWCAMTAAGRGLRVAVVDHGAKTARKVRISGGGRCNFTNLNAGPAHYVCANPHFVKSALARFSPWDVVGFLGENGITYEERDHGQLFTLEGAGRVAGALQERSTRAGAELFLGRSVSGVSGKGPFHVRTTRGELTGDKLVLALGGPSWPQAGASDFGFQLARQYGLKLVPARPGLVPLVFPRNRQPMCAEMAGNALPATVETGGARFTDPLLFTHRGISGPAVLQASNYWREGQPVVIDYLPGTSLEDFLAENRASNAQLRNLLSPPILPSGCPPAPGPAPGRNPGQPALQTTDRNRLRAHPPLHHNPVLHRGPRQGRSLPRRRGHGPRLLQNHGNPRRTGVVCDRRNPRRHRPSGRLQSTLGVRLGPGLRGGLVAANSDSGRIVFSRARITLPAVVVEQKKGPD